jgi:hypothetical protein
MEVQLLRSARIFFLLAIFFASAPSFAGSVSLGYVITTITQQDGVFFVSTSGVRAGTPTCATNATRFVLNGGTTNGQLVVANILTAYASGKQIAISGTGDCSFWGDTESISYIITQ